MGVMINGVEQVEAKKDSLTIQAEQAAIKTLRWQ